MRIRTISTLSLSGLAALLLVAGGPASGSSSGGQKAQQGSKLENRALFAVMTGRKEVDANGRRGAGDPDGRGSFTATVDGDQLCFGITVKNIDNPVAAHIHRGRPNENGPIVVPLTHPSSGDPGASSGCVDAQTAVSRAILKNPHRYYANVHTGPFPGGAVRGQLFRKSN
jgi:CHRD domain